MSRSDAPCHRVTLVWTDEDRSLSVGEDETVLDAAIDSGVDLPYSCRWGACAVCTAEVLEGELVHVDPPRVLREEHLKNDYVLLCIASPRTDCRIRVARRYEIARELHSSRW